MGSCELVSFRGSRDNTWHFFMTVDKTPVCYVMVDDSSGDPVLELIETRDIFRGYGYAKQAITEVAHTFGRDTLVSSGVFTHDGNTRIKHLLDSHSPSSVRVSDDGFGFTVYVADWENMVPAF